MVESHGDMTAARIRELVGVSPVLLEIGANGGEDTVKFLAAMPAAAVYCFEPDPRAIARWKQNVGEDWRATLVEAAVCDVNGEATFYGSSGDPPRKNLSPDYRGPLTDWDLSGSILKPTGHLAYSPWTTFPKDRQFAVKTIRLDDWAARVGVIGAHFIWCDVQGAEHLVIQGGRRFLSRSRYFYTEIRSGMELYAGQKTLAELGNMLGSGFELLGIYGGDNALFRKVDCG